MWAFILPSVRPSIRAPLVARHILPNLFNAHLKGFVLICCWLLPAALFANQDALKPVINKEPDRVMTFDWPMIRVGTGEYTQGPTGVTVFQFAEKANVAIDSRGGGPGTVNADYMQLGYDLAELDTVVFAGGSWYGLEATTAVASALKDDGIRDGDAFSLEPNIAMSVGSIIFDFGARRLNEIYPDKKLAQAAFRAAKTGEFPLGAEGAGRFALSGGLFGCNAYSGQGGAFRQIGDIKIAAFTVVNSLGVITDRMGNSLACYTETGSAEPNAEQLKTADILTNYVSRYADKLVQKQTRDVSRKNTTVSLVVTNQKLTPAELQRLAVQVHTSMARGIQPFATIFDGDVLYAVSTAEVEEQQLMPHELGTIAGEVMWDAILSSVPAQPALPKPTKNLPVGSKQIKKFAGNYRFSAMASLKVEARGKKLFARATGLKQVYGIGKDEAVELLPVTKTDFTVPGRYPLLLRFAKDGRLIINPGHWQQIGERN